MRVCVRVCVCVRVSVCMTSSLSSVDGHFGCLHILAVVNSAAMNVGVHVSFQVSVSISFGHIPKSRITESDVALFLVF